MLRRLRSLILVVALALPAVGASQPAAPQPEIIFATTTSVQDTELLDVIVPLFEKTSGYRVKAVAVGTGQALAMAARGEADVVLAHAPDTEKKHIADGTLTNRRFMMHNWFLFAGPPTDPAKIKGTTKAVEALKKIAETNATFVSRGDDSGTHKLEMRLWEKAEIKPSGEWYLQAGQGMSKTLGIAGEKQAYVITDRATYLAFQKTTGLAVLLEGDPAFLNIYHVMEVNAEKFPKVNAAGGKAFADFLLSATVQDVLNTFGKEKFGEALFTPDAGKTAETVLQ
ncbi:MAG: tungsten ABC transporter substrate-binding protein [Deltaproteobacteria bacterium]|nr:tungsten ABC transporter substrate-binding protein [Deltaproteobacteria bacterium]